LTIFGISGVVGFGIGREGGEYVFHVFVEDQAALNRLPQRLEGVRGGRHSKRNPKGF
jgi:hypothetical protein